MNRPGKTSRTPVKINVIGKMNAANILRNVELSSIQSLDSHESAPGFSYLGNLHYIARKASVLKICLLSDHLCHTLNWLVHKNPDALNTRYRIYFPYHMVCIWILVASKLWSWIFLRLLSFLFLPCCYPPASYFFFFFCGQNLIFSWCLPLKTTFSQRTAKFLFY